MGVFVAPDHPLSLDDPLDIHTGELLLMDGTTLPASPTIDGDKQDYALDPESDKTQQSSRVELVLIDSNVANAMVPPV